MYPQQVACGCATWLTFLTVRIHWCLVVLPEAKQAQKSPSEVKKHPVMNQLKNKIDGSSKIILNHHRSQFFATLSFRNFLTDFSGKLRVIVATKMFAASHWFDSHKFFVFLVWPWLGGWAAEASLKWFTTTVTPERLFYLISEGT